MNYYGNDVENYVLAKCSGDDYLMHKQHKYIKRVWKNGKWRYYYKTPKGEWKDAKLLSKASDMIGEDERERARRSYMKYSEESFNYAMAKDADPSTSSNRYNTYRRWAEEYCEEYRRTPLGKLESVAYAGKQFIDEIFKKK